MNNLIYLIEPTPSQSFKIVCVYHQKALTEYLPIQVCNSKVDSLL